MDAKDYKDHILTMSNANQLKDYYSTPNPFPSAQGTSYNDKYNMIYKNIKSYCAQNNYNITPDEISQWTIELIGNNPNTIKENTDAFGREVTSGTKSMGIIADELNMPEVHYTNVHSTADQDPNKWYNKNPRYKRDLGLGKTFTEKYNKELEEHPQRSARQNYDNTVRKEQNIGARSNPEYSSAQHKSGQINRQYDPDITRLTEAVYDRTTSR